MKPKSLDARSTNPVTVEVRRMKAVAFSPVVIVVSMCECNWVCRRVVKDSMMLSEYL